MTEQHIRRDGEVGHDGRNLPVHRQPGALPRRAYRGALDARPEFEVFGRFKELSDGKAAILISHRFSSVRTADRILVLAVGKVEAAGLHAELMTQNGRYAELFELQAAG